MSVSNLPQPLHSVQELQDRLAEVKAEQGQVVHDQHVITKLLMKRFASADNKIESISVVHPLAKSRLLGPKAAGKVVDFVPFASASMEKVWSEVEQRLPQALALCDRDALYDDPAAVATIRDAIALHLARSRQTRLVHVQGYRLTRAAFRASTPDSLLDALFLSRHGLHVPPGYSAMREMAFDELVQDTDENFSSGALLRARIQMIFEDVQAWFAKPHREIEIIKAAEGSFLIGDVPALTLGRNGEIGVLGGAPIGDAYTIIMPISPQRVLAIGPKPEVTAVPKARVDQLNRYQVLGAIEHVFAHPDSRLAQFVRATRFGDSSKDRAAA